MNSTPQTLVCFGSLSKTHLTALAYAHRGIPVNIQSLPAQPPLITGLVNNFLLRYKQGTWFYLNCATDCYAWILMAENAKYGFGFFERTLEDRLRLYHLNLRYEIELVWEEEKPQKKITATAN
jgi:hypothetical protein